MGAVSSNVSGRNARMGGPNIPHIAHCTLYTAYSTLHTKYGILHTTCSTLHTTYWVLLHTLQCNLYTVEVAQIAQKLKTAQSKSVG